MSFADKYLLKNTFNDSRIQASHWLDLDFFIPAKPASNLGCVVVIPAYNESGIIHCLESLKNCQPPKQAVEVLIVVNFSESESKTSKEFNLALYDILCKWSLLNSTVPLSFYPILANNLPKKHAGAGLARKLGMDLAIQRFNYLNKPNGLILSLDADSLVSSHYFKKVEEFLSTSPKSYGCIFNFAHPLADPTEKHLESQAIALYELHLRLYKQLLKATGFPHYHFTIGSCFAVKALPYVRYGGMNKRQAGEDFYFLHKLYPDGNFRFIKEVCVFPSSRVSDRVPFGTGPMVRQIIENKGKLLTYNPASFVELQQFFQKATVLYNSNQNALLDVLSSLPKHFRTYLLSIGIIEHLAEINSNTASLPSFMKRFLRWFDAFQIIKYLNHCKQSHHPDVPVLEAAHDFLASTNRPFGDSLLETLEIFRKLDLES